MREFLEAFGESEKGKSATRTLLIAFWCIYVAIMFVAIPTGIEVIGASEAYPREFPLNVILGTVTAAVTVGWILLATAAASWTASERQVHRRNPRYTPTRMRGVAMKNRELILELEHLDPDLPVAVPDLVDHEDLGRRQVEGIRIKQLHPVINRVYPQGEDPTQEYDECFGVENGGECQCESRALGPLTPVIVIPPWSD